MQQRGGVREPISNVLPCTWQQSSSTQSMKLAASSTHKKHFQHTQEAFPDRILWKSSNPAMLQCITSSQDLHLPLHLPRGIKLLIQEQPPLAAHRHMPADNMS